MKFPILILACLVNFACNPGPPLSPLIVASREGDTSRIAELVKAGADVNERGGVNNWTPLMHGIHKNQSASVRKLLNAGADVNLTAGARGGDTALRLAEVNHESEIAQLLRARGAK